ncbi:unnamed protein product [Urochloa humidicola]
MPKQSGEGRMEPTAASSVADADGGGACPQPLPTAVMDGIEPFARLVKLLGRGFYTDVVIRDGEVRTSACDENRSLAVAVLDCLTRFAWIKESELAKLLKIKEKTLILLLQFLEKEKFLKRELTKGTQEKINDAIAEKEDGSFDVLAGSYCCLDYPQIVDVTRYWLHRMKKSIKEKLDYRAMVEEYICCICKKSYSALDVVHLISKSGNTFCCENCNGELVAQNGDATARRESRANSVNMLKRFKVEIPLPNSSARLDGAESDSDYTGVKVLPMWIVQKGMSLTKAEKGEQQPNKDERWVGMKAKRSGGGSGGNSYNVVESGATSRRRT